MRRSLVLLVAAVAALGPVPAASAHDAPAEQVPAACPPPDVVAQYHPDRMSVYVSLPTTGCPTRENGEFSLQLWLDRVDKHTGEGHGRVVPCGWFRPSSGADVDPSAAPSDTCELDMWIGHPSPEAAHYDLAVTYPGADGEETLEYHSFCTSDDNGAFCVDADAR
jgi:hypothetical protein